jgi:hypothetical protein
VNIKTILKLSCLGYLSSVIMDSYLWITGRHYIPSWTMAVMSGGMIVLIQALIREPFSNKNSE